MTLLCGPVRASSIRAGSIRYLRILSVYLAYRRSVLDNTGELTDTTLVAALFGGPSGGTIASGRALVEAVAADRGVLDASLQPYLSSPDPSRERDFGPQSDQALQRARDITPA